MFILALRVGPCFGIKDSPSGNKEGIREGRKKSDSPLGRERALECSEGHRVGKNMKIHFNMIKKIKHFPNTFRSSSCFCTC